MQNVSCGPFRMVHSYMFRLFPNTLEAAFLPGMNGPESSTQIIISYDQNVVEDNDFLERVARSLITYAVVNWFRNDMGRIENEIRLSSYRGYLLTHGHNDIADWVGLYNDCSLHNLGSPHEAQLWIIFQ